MSEAIKVTWITQDNRQITASVPVGHTLMEAAVAHNVPGIIGECGGALACATCHVIVEHAPAPLEDMNRTETEMLEFAEVPRTASSRLSCQIRSATELDGLVLRIPGA